MSAKEIYDDLEKDSQRIRIWAEKLYPSIIKKFKKSHSFPVWHIEKYDAKYSRNCYYLFYYAANAKEVAKPRCIHYYVAYFDNQRYVVTWGETIHQDGYVLPVVNAYTSHFLDRYKERFLYKKDLSANEAAGIFLVRNILHTPIKMNKNINKHYKNYGDYNDHGMHVTDGFCFTRAALEEKEGKDHADAIVIVYTTFMNESNMEEAQRVAINKEHIETLKHCFMLMTK